VNKKKRWELMSMQKQGHIDLPLTNSRGERFLSIGKYLLLFLCMLTLAVSAAAVHTSTVDLQPEWSPADSDVDYTVTFCKTSGAEVNEVRIYKNYDGSIYYSGFSCDDKPGWEK
jgi:hypothetical protein